MESPLVSVIIPNYNYADYLREAIASVLAQTYENIEIIVVDDGSSDNSRATIESYGEKVTGIFQQNQGVSATRNNGVKASRGEYIAFLDADDVWLPRKIELQMAKFAAVPTLGMVHVAVDEVDSDGNVLAKKRNGLDGRRTPDFFMLTIECVYGGGSGIILPRRIFDEAGGFDTRLSTSADWDLFCRISERYEVAFVEEVLLRYRVHNSNMHANVGAMEHDMILAFEKAFAAPAADVAAIRRRAYGNLHLTLAGSYLAAGWYGAFVRHSLTSVAYDPRNIARFLRLTGGTKMRRGAPAR